jgi:3-oxoacyl-[acyl-carrier protein] reductase
LMVPAGARWAGRIARSMDLGIDGKLALVTGASKGLGMGVATELAREGARVAIASRSEKRIREAAASIGAHPVRA